MTYKNFNLKILTTKHWNWIDACIYFMIAASILGFLSFKSWTNTCLFLILTIAIAQTAPTYNFLRNHTNPKSIFPLVIALSLPIFSILFSQYLRHEWIFKAYDAPARILFSAPIFFYFIYRKIDYVSIIKVCAPIALLILVPVTHDYLAEINYWGGRFATSFVDPNMFGTYTLVLTAFCLFSLTPNNIKSIHQVNLCLGFVSGLYLLIGSQTRGSWLSIPPLLILWINLRFSNIRPRSAYLAILSFIILPLLFSIYFFPETSDRLKSVFTEIYNWIDNSQTDTSTGVRLSMWKLAWALYVHNPISGYGDTGYLKLLDEPWLAKLVTPYIKETIVNGPHNEVLANLLRSGTLGGISTLCLFLVPLHLFWKNRHNHETKPACDLGIALITTLMLCSISIEVFTLKYTSSFFGLTIAGLAAQVIRSQNSILPSASEDKEP